MLSASRMAPSELRRHLPASASVPPTPPAPPIITTAATPPSAPQPKWYVLETEVNPITHARAYLARDDRIATTSITARNAEDVQTLHECAHALNHHANLRDVLSRAGEALVRRGFAGGLLSEIDKALADSKA